MTQDATSETTNRQRTSAEHPTDASTDSAADSPFAAVGPADEIETALDAVATVVDECVVAVDSDGLSVAAMDPATVAMVSLSLSADAFESFAATEARLGVNLDRLLDVVGMADRGGVVEFALDAETRTLHVRVGDLSYTLALIDPDAIRSPPDRIDLEEQYEATVALPGRELSRAVRAADMVSDHLELGVDGKADLLYARADGDTDSVAVEIPAEDCDEFEPGPAHSLFSLDYLSDVDRAVPADRPVRLRLGEEAPVEIDFAFADGDGSVTYAVSPRIVSR